jgi:hypothetical protein
VRRRSGRCDNEVGGEGRHANKAGEVDSVGPIVPRMRKPPQKPRGVIQTVFIVRGC